jgi:hypothetical protein
MLQMNVTSYLDVIPFCLVDRNTLAYIAIRMLVVEEKKLALILPPVQQSTRGQIRKIVMVIPPRAPATAFQKKLKPK